MSNRINIKSGAPWEEMASYSRAVRIGNIIEVAGTTAVQDGRIAFPGDAAAQTKLILEIIRKAIKEAGGGLKDVVRTRIYVANIKDWEKVAEVHGTFFEGIMPATTLVEVSALVSPEMLVEIEATAYIQSHD